MKTHGPPQEQQKQRSEDEGKVQRHGCARRVQRLVQQYNQKAKQRQYSEVPPSHEISSLGVWVARRRRPAPANGEMPSLMSPMRPKSVGGRGKPSVASRGSNVHALHIGAITLSTHKPPWLAWQLRQQPLRPPTHMEKHHT